MLTLLNYSINQSFLPEHYFSYIMWVLKVSEWGNVDY